MDWMGADRRPFLSLCCDESSVSFEQFYASELISFEPGPGAGFGQDQLPGIVLGPPDGRGPDAGGSTC